MLSPAIAKMPMGEKQHRDLRVSIGPVRLLLPQSDRQRVGRRPRSVVRIVLLSSQRQAQWGARVCWGSSSGGGCSFIIGDRANDDVTVLTKVGKRARTRALPRARRRHEEDLE